MTSWQDPSLVKCLTKYECDTELFIIQVNAARNAKSKFANLGFILNIKNIKRREEE